jgi:rubrerythrin
MEDILGNNGEMPVEKAVDDPKVSAEDLDMRWIRWKCLVCGYVYEGVNQLKVCPKCGNEDVDKFEEVE